jgi:hypothetical protein
MKFGQQQCVIDGDHFAGMPDRRAGTFRRGAVEIVCPAPRSTWRAALAGDSSCLLSHTPEWLDTVCAVDGWTDVSRLYVWPSGRYLVLPMVGNGIGEFIFVEDSLPAGWGFGGLVGTGTITPEEVAVVCADLRARRLLRQRLCPNPVQGTPWQHAIARGAWNAGTIPRCAHVVDLDGGTGAIWKRFSENARRCIRKAERQGLEVECDTTGRLLGAFDQLWRLSAQRWAAQQREPVWLARARTTSEPPKSMAADSGTDRGCCDLGRAPSRRAGGGHRGIAGAQRPLHARSDVQRNCRADPSKFLAALARHPGRLPARRPVVPDGPVRPGSRSSRAVQGELWCPSP